MENLTNDEQGFLDELMGGTFESEPQPDPEPETPESESEPETSETPPEENPEQPETTDDILNGISDNQHKANQAFAEMRTKNKQQEQLISKMAQALGFDPQTMQQDDLLNQLNTVVTTAQAQKQNIPVELLQRLNDLEATNSLYRQDHMRAQARDGLNLLKEKYSATQEELSDFVTALTSEGLNPLEDTVDFEAEYLKRNFSRIVEKQVKSAVHEEAQRSAKAEQHASTPNNTNGSAKQDEPAKINSVRELDAFFAEHI